MLYGSRSTPVLAEIILILEDPNLSAEQFDSMVVRRWAVVKVQLNSILRSVSRAEIQERVSSERLQEILLGVHDNLESTIAYIDVAVISKQNDQNMRDELSDLFDKIQKINIAANIQVNSLTEEMSTLVDWANSSNEPQAGESQISKQIQEDYTSALEELTVINLSTRSRAQI
jgi:hypothetical protein